MGGQSLRAVAGMYITVNLTPLIIWIFGCICNNWHFNSAIFFLLFRSVSSRGSKRPEYLRRVKQTMFYVKYYPYERKGEFIYWIKRIPRKSGTFRDKMLTNTIFVFTIKIKCIKCCDFIEATLSIVPCSVIAAWWYELIYPNNLMFLTITRGRIFICSWERIEGVTIPASSECQKALWGAQFIYIAHCAHYKCDIYCGNAYKSTHFLLYRLAVFGAFIPWPIRNMCAEDTKTIQYKITLLEEILHFAGVQFWMQLIPISRVESWIGNF